MMPQFRPSRQVNISIRFLVTVVVLINISTKLQAQWVQTNGPQGGYVECFDFDSTFVFAGTLGSGVFRSTDAGSSWNSSGLANHAVYAILKAGSHRLAATNTGVFLSSDDGSSWTAANSGLTTQPIATLSVSGTNIFAGRSYYVASEFIAGGVFLSIDGGVSWTPRGLSNVGVSTLVGTDTSVFAVTGGTLLVSTDTGKSWNPTGLVSAGIVGLTKRQGNLYACSYDGEVFLSSDGGSSWVTISLIPTGQYVFGLVSGATRLYAWTTDTLYVSDEPGTSWAISYVGTGSPLILGVGARGTNVYVGTYGLGVVRSTNAGVDWDLTNSGLRLTVVTSLLSKGNKLYAGTQYPPKVFETSNSGDTWNSLSSPEATSAVQGIVAIGSNLFIGCYTSGVFRSTDDGATWIKCNSGLTNVNVDALAISGENLLVGTYGSGLFLSRDSASSWNPVGPSNLGVTCLAANGTDVLVGATSRVLLSHDNGVSWVFVDSGITGNYVNSVAISGTRLFAGTDGNGVFVSSNSGSSWVANGPKNTFVRSMTANATAVFAGSTVAGIFVSTNNGTTWYSVNVGLTDTAVTSLAVNGEFLYAGTNGDGVWRRLLSEIITSEDRRRTEVPMSLVLEQNYPNPFNPSTMIRIDLPTRSRIRITIFNLLGQQIAELANEEMSAGGHERVWNADVASGLYFYRLEAVSLNDPNKRFVDVKKMVLLR
jgi:photosystem II stability/assembly factor-like uncharacterized protein